MLKSNHITFVSCFIVRKRVKVSDCQRVFCFLFALLINQADKGLFLLAQNMYVLLSFSIIV